MSKGDIIKDDSLKATPLREGTQHFVAFGVGLQQKGEMAFGFGLQQKGEIVTSSDEGMSEEEQEKTC
ncbi:hypothetical protein GRJ2_000245900 [Grus japonensis]|uniref:Uncharacterized protein n=1 Tax=Grus japonensis TaxID=30415 RepID=A0ABC9VWN2_GRUJA